MNPIRDVAYWAKRTLLGIYGSATLDPKNDPVEQLKREHGDEVRADGEAPAETVVPPVDDAATAGWDQGRANAGDQPDGDPQRRF